MDGDAWALPPGLLESPEGIPLRHGRIVPAAALFVRQRRQRRTIEELVTLANHDTSSNRLVLCLFLFRSALLGTFPVRLSLLGTLFGRARTSQTPAARFPPLLAPWLLVLT
jgi:hypothetical protein